MADFMNNIDFFGPDILVNMSVWKDSKSLHEYVYRTSHAQIMSRRKEWFERFENSYTVLWWIPEGHIPTLGEANDRLELLRAVGPTVEAFTFKQDFSMPH